MRLELKVDTQTLAQALVAGPAVLEKHLRLAILRVTQDVARDAKRHAPEAVSTLANSIHGVAVSAYEGLVIAGTDYARAVEEGTQGGAIPPESNILDWIKVRRIQPRDPAMTQADLAYVIARSIAHKGTPAQPFMRPALEANRDRAVNRINAAIDAALKEIAA